MPRLQSLQFQIHEASLPTFGGLRCGSKPSAVQLLRLRHPSPIIVRVQRSKEEDRNATDVRRARPETRVQQARGRGWRSQQIHRLICSDAVRGEMEKCGAPGKTTRGCGYQCYTANHVADPIQSLWSSWGKRPTSDALVLWKKPRDKLLLAV